MSLKENQPGLQRAIYDKINAECGTAPDHVSLDYGHGRIMRRSKTIYSEGCGRRWGEGVQDRFVTTDLDTLATALYARTDDC